MKLAACALVFNKEGLVLAVSRKDDPNDFGLPGGKVEVDESLMQAAVRETMEETGCILKNLRMVYAAQNGDYMSVTFQAEYDGEPIARESGKVAWVHPVALTKGSFGDYNMNLFKALGTL